MTMKLEEAVGSLVAEYSTYLNTDIYYLSLLCLSFLLQNRDNTILLNRFVRIK